MSQLCKIHSQLATSCTFCLLFLLCGSCHRWLTNVFAWTVRKILPQTKRFMLPLRIFTIFWSCCYSRSRFVELRGAPARLGFPWRRCCRLVRFLSSMILYIELIFTCSRVPLIKASIVAVCNIVFIQCIDVLFVSVSRIRLLFRTLGNRSSIIRSKSCQLVALPRWLA